MTAKMPHVISTLDHGTLLRVASYTPYRQGINSQKGNQKNVFFNFLLSLFYGAR